MRFPDPKRAVLLVAALLTAGILRCAGDAPTVIPDPTTQTFTGTPPGTSAPQFTGSYPESGETDIPVDANIVLVFSKPVKSGSFDTGTWILINGGAVTYTVSFASSDRTVILNPNSDFAYGTTYTIDITTNLIDTDDIAIAGAVSYSFTTTADVSSYALPRVVASSREPSAGATGVSVNTSFVEATFSRDMSAASFNTTNFSISPAIASGVDTGISLQTFRLLLTTPLDYSQTYTIDLTTGILDTATNPLVQDGNDTWTFTTEADPAPAGTTVSNVWISSVTATGATVSFTTSKPVAKNRCYALHDTNPTVTSADTHTQENISTALATTHTVSITGLNPSTLYYVRGGVDTTTVADGTADVLSTADQDFYTRANATVNTALTTAAGNQNDIKTVQISDGSGYVFWTDTNTNNVMGQRFNTTGVAQWAAGGVIINTAANVASPVAISDHFSDALILYRDAGNNLYAKRYNNAGQVWVQATLGLTTSAGSSYSVCLVHELPTVIATGTADMPDNGAAVNLLYDRDVDFSSIAFLDAGDILARDNGGTAWPNGAIQVQSASPTDIFQYVLKSTAFNPNLAAIVDYYVIDANVTISGIADSATTTTQLRSSTTNLSTVKKDDIIQNTTNTEWGIAAADGAWDVGGWWYVNLDRALALLNDTDAFTIYTNHSGPYTSEAVTNPFWDKLPTTPFNPETTVLTGDRVVNMSSTPAKCSTVAATDLTRDTDYALRLDTAGIMNNAQNYSIIRMPSSSTYKFVGHSTADLDYGVNDTSAPFAVGNIGDIVCNLSVTPILSALITGFTDTSNVTLSADIFTAANQRYIAYTKRAFLVAYIDGTNSYVLARSFNIIDGSPLGAVFGVCTAGVCSTPVAVSDEAGNAIIFYRYGATIYVKKVSATGTLLWADPANDDFDTGITVLAGYTIVQALPDRASAGVGGAYLLAENGSGAIALCRVNGTTGAVTWTRTITDGATTFGYDPHMAVDTNAAGVNRVIITYLGTHTGASGGTYRHVRAVAYNPDNSVSFGPTDVTGSGAAIEYHCENPRLSIADTTAADSLFYISWFDGRYITYIGYSIYAQQFSNDGVAQWANAVFIGSPTSWGYDNALLLDLLYFDDDAGIAPFGITPIWLDYRAGNTDIYYDRRYDTGAKFP